MIQVNRIYLIFNRLVTKKFLVDTSELDSIIIIASQITLPRLEELLDTLWNTVYTRHLHRS